MQIAAQTASNAFVRLRFLVRHHLPCSHSISCCSYCFTFFGVQVISYISELLAKVREQQAQAERITGFQAQFGYVYTNIFVDAVLLPNCNKWKTFASLYPCGQLDATAINYRKAPRFEGCKK